MADSLFVDEDRPRERTARGALRLAVGGDHAGLLLKGPVVEWLRAWGHTVEDFGTHTVEPVDFPDIAHRVCDAVRSKRADRGILVCGTGVGASIAANKHGGIRAAVGHDVYSAHQCVEHDDVNVLCVGAQIVGHKLAAEIVRAFTEARFAGDPAFVRRLEKLAELERREAGRTSGESGAR